MRTKITHVEERYQPFAIGPAEMNRNNVLTRRSRENRTLTPNTPYGVSVWALFLLEKYAHHRPLRAVSRMLSAHGLDVAPGTLADSLPRFAPLFAPLAAAIAERQAAAHVAHGDEASWTVHAATVRAAGCGCA